MFKTALVYASPWPLPLADLPPGLPDDLAERLDRHADEHTGIHQLRHHVASLLLTQGMSIAEVAEVLGDTVQEVSETYAHAMPDFGKRLRSINASRGARIAAAREESSTEW